MPPNKFSKKRETQKMKVSQLYLMGFSCAKIAQEVGTSRQTIHTMITELEAEWRKYWMPAVDAVRTKKIAELNQLKSQAYTSLLIAQREQNHMVVKMLGDLILKVIQTENKIYQLYDTNAYKKHVLNIEELISDYETAKLELDDVEQDDDDSETFDDDFTGA